MKPKRAYEDHASAIEACKKLNMRPEQITKLVSYKCKVCYKYHIGRNGKKITDKYREKHTIKASDSVNKSFKIIGKIDLDKL